MQVLKKIPGATRDPGGENTNAVLNDSVMALLHSHCGANTTRRNPQRQGQKIVPGISITSVKTTLLQL